MILPWLFDILCGLMFVLMACVWVLKQLDTKIFDCRKSEIIFLKQPVQVFLIFRDKQQHPKQLRSTNTDLILLNLIWHRFLLPATLCNLCPMLLAQSSTPMIDAHSSSWALFVHSDSRQWVFINFFSEFVGYNRDCDLCGYYLWLGGRWWCVKLEADDELICVRRSFRVGRI